MYVYTQCVYNVVEQLTTSEQWAWFIYIVYACILYIYE